MADISKAFDRVCEKFGITELNKHQKEAITQIVQRKTDVFINLPTGFGKYSPRTVPESCGQGHEMLCQNKRLQKKNAP